MADEAPNPHDALVRSIFGTPALMAEELRAILPAELTAQLDLGSLQAEPARFIDAQLQGAESDLLFSARLGGQRALIYVLVEHQSSPDRFMPLRLLRYIGRILDAHRHKHPGDALLPVVLPIVLYHDAKPWPYPVDFAALLNGPADLREVLQPYVPDFRFVLEDLARLDVDALLRREASALVKVALFALKRARHAANFIAELLGIAHLFRALESGTVPDSQLSSLLAYIWTTARADRTQRLSFAKTHAWPRWKLC